MAVKSGEHLNPELSENGDMMLFAEDLVHYMVCREIPKYPLKWDPRLRRDHIYNAFEPTIKKAIHLIGYALEMDHDGLYFEMGKVNFINSESYERFAKILATKYFPGGFDANYFLVYCVNLSVMATNFYKYDICDAPNLAKIHIYRCMKNYMSAGGWVAVSRIAEMLGNSVSDINLIGEYDFEVPDQEELGYESNSSLSEEQSVTSENEENGLEPQRKRACSNIKAYQKYTHYFSESSSEIGSCSLKEPEPPSEDKSPGITLEESMPINRSESDNKPTAGTSNVDQKLIRIIDDFKNKLILSWNEIKAEN